MPAISDAATARVAIDRALSALAQIDAAADSVALTRARLVAETELAAAKALLAPPPALTETQKRQRGTVNVLLLVLAIPFGFAALTAALGL